MHDVIVLDHEHSRRRGSIARERRNDLVDALGLCIVVASPQRALHACNEVVDRDTPIAVAVGGHAVIR